MVSGEVEIMEYLQQRVYKEHNDQTICTFWIDENGEVDSDNLPSNGEFAELLKQLRVHDISVEFTGKIVED